jgi:hypothetical protein
MNINLPSLTSGLLSSPSDCIYLWNCYLVIVVVHVHGVRLCLWTVAPSGPFVGPPGDIWSWRDMVKLYRQGNQRIRT